MPQKYAQSAPFGGEKRDFYSCILIQISDNQHVEKIEKSVSGGRLLAFTRFSRVFPLHATRSAGRCNTFRRSMQRVASARVARRFILCKVICKEKLLLAPVRVPVSLRVLPQCLPAGLLFQLPDGEGEVGVGEWFVAEREVPPLGVQRLKAAFEHGFTQNHAVAELLLGDAAASG